MLSSRLNKVWTNVLMMVVTSSLTGMACAQGMSAPFHAPYAITARVIARALSAVSAPIAASQVSLLAEVVATEENPVLDIKSVEPFGTKESNVRSRVKLACHLAGQCLPFYVVVSWPAGEQSHAFSASGASTMPLSAHLQTRTDRVIIMKAGTHAMLVMDDGRARIQLDVISLENGIAGHRIRVATPDRKQTYVAEVVSANLLKGSF